MRFIRLHLKAYGPFTDQVVDLSEGEFGLHVVYGDNEAGKSSSLRAITDLLFGIPMQTSDDFVHPYKKLRIGAELRHSDGTELGICRRKARKSLYDQTDSRLLEESELRKFVGQVDRELFHLMFGIDHERLRMGGAEIVQGEGRIGEMLFSAGSGIAHLQSIQKSLANDMEKLLKSSGRSGRIVDDINLYKTAQQELKQVMVSAETWKHLDQQSHESEQRKADLEKEIEEKDKQKNRLSRIQQAISAVTQWKQKKNQLQQVADVPRLPDDFEQKSGDLIVRLRQADLQKKAAADELQKLRKNLDELSIPEVLLREAEAIEMIRERLGEYRKAMSDRPELESSRENAEKEAREILRELDRPTDLAEIENLRLPNEQVIRIQSLGNQKEGLVQQLKAFRDILKKTGKRISDCERELAEIGDLPDVDKLRRVLQRINKEGDLERRLRSIRLEMKNGRDEALVQLSRLGLWTGELEELEQLAVPQVTTIEKFSEEMKENQTEIKSVRKGIRGKESEQADLETQLESLEQGRPVPTEDELVRAREKRQMGWQLILAAQRTPSELETEIQGYIDDFDAADTLEEAYQLAVQQADEIVDALRSDADRVARKQGLQVSIQHCQREIAGLHAELENQERQYAEIQERWKALWSPVALEPLSPLEMRDWIRKQQEVAELVRNCRQQSLEERELAGRIEEMIGELKGILDYSDGETLPESETLEGWMGLATSRLEAVDEDRRRYEQLVDNLKRNREEQEEAASQYSRAEQELRDWEQSWETEMRKLGLSVDAFPEQANRVLEDIRRLFDKFKEADRYRERLEALDRDAARFETDVKSLAARALPDLKKTSAEDTVLKLHAALADARKQDDRRINWELQLEDQTAKRNDAEQAIGEVTVALQSMCEQAECDTFDDLANRAQQSSQRKRLEEMLLDWERQILELSGGSGLQEFIEEVESEGGDFDSIPSRIETLKTEIEDLRKQRDECRDQINDINRELSTIDGGSIASEKLLTCENIKSELHEKISEFAIHRLAMAVLNSSVEQYRERNQGPVLSRANEIFKRLTCGAYSGLQTDYDHDGVPVLKGVRQSSGNGIEVSAMSDGTCDQLYLALRLASLENWLTRHEPLPLIVDDVLLNFDDARAVASLKVLAEMSRRTQIIFFTHHRHLVDMARATVGEKELFIVELNRNHAD